MLLNLRPARPAFILALATMFKRSYWTVPNTVELFAFLIKAIIIVPGLVFEIQIWWLYLFAFASSVSLIWTSTAKTLPTLIWFNLVWAILALAAIGRYLLGLDGM